MNERLTRAALPALPLALVLLVAACGDGSGSASPTASPPAATATPEASPTAEPSPGLSPSPNPLSSPTGSGTELEKLAATFVAGVDGKVVYEYSSNFGGKPNGTLTTYIRGGDYRQDWQTSLGEIDFTSTAILVGDEAYACDKTFVSEDCVEVTPEYIQLQRNPFQPIQEVPERIAAGPAGMKVEELAPRKLAGVDVLCFAVTISGRLGPGAEGSEELELCFASNGRFLLMERRVIFDDESVPDGILHLEAQSVGPATADDFKPPAPLQ